MDMKMIPQAKMTGECWMVQFNGLEACKTCDYLGKRDCGGKSIRKTLKNEKGYNVPVV